MKKVITYGTFDLFHYGHYFLLKRAKKLGDYLVVGVSSDEMCLEKGKKCVLPEQVRLQMVKDLNFVDEVIIEESMHQKVEDIEKMSIDVFCIGDDYKEKLPKMEEYSFLKKNCDVVYLERTPDISTSKLKESLLRQIELDSIF